MFQYSAHHIYKTNGSKETIDSILNGPYKDECSKSLGNKWGDLDQGNIHGVRSTDTIGVIQRHEVPKNRNVTYATYVLDHKPLKEKQFRLQITVGGDRLSYLDDARFM